jgi:hypothetical protein
VRGDVVANGACAGATQQWTLAKLRGWRGGANEAAQMKRLAGRYQLMLTFAERSGAYLADVAVQVADQRGQTLLDTSCDAPIMLLNFPKDGRYQITAEFDGQRRRAMVTVGRRHGRTLALLWPRGHAQNQG